MDHKAAQEPGDEHHDPSDDESLVHVGPQNHKIPRSESDEQKYLPLMVLAHVLLSGAFVWIYARGVESKPWVVQGVRFGVAVALLTIVPTYLIYFVVQPMPAALVIKQIAFDSILLVILGMVVAFMYEDTPTLT